MDMPATVRMYFDADSRNDAEAVSKTFAMDAVVEDEGARHQGTAIRAWWAAAKAAAQYVAEPLEATADGEQTRVLARVSGQFPGSPVTLAYSFTVKDDRIVRLEIK